MVNNNFEDNATKNRYLKKIWLAISETNIFTVLNTYLVFFLVKNKYLKRTSKEENNHINSQVVYL